MANRGRGRRGRPRGTSPVFYQQAFTEAVGVVATVIAQASAVRGQGGSSDLQRFRTHHPLTGMGGEDSMVRTALAIGVDNVRSIRDLGASAKRKESQPSSSFGKKQKTSVSRRSRGQGRGHQGQGQGQSSRGGGHFRAPSQSG